MAAAHVNVIRGFSAVDANDRWVVGNGVGPESAESLLRQAARALNRDVFVNLLTISRFWTRSSFGHRVRVRIPTGPSKEHCESTMMSTDVHDEAGGRPIRRAGFTLVELMVVVAIIGVISSIALPSFQTYARRSKRSEAFLNLAGIYKAQKVHYTEKGEYGATFDEIGFEISGAMPIDATTIQSQYYTYTLEAIDLNGSPNANYSAVATGDLDPGDAMLDIIMIESGVVIKN